MAPGGARVGVGGSFRRRDEAVFELLLDLAEPFDVASEIAAGAGNCLSLESVNLVEEGVGSWWGWVRGCHLSLDRITDCTATSPFQGSG
jgi:hypothetical protein